MSTHVIMKRSLAKALMEAGMEHFDAGGTVQQPPAGTTISQGQLGTMGPGFNGQFGPVGGGISTLGASYIAPVFTNTAGGVIQGTGQLMQGIGAAFTPQDQFVANSPYSPTTLQNAVTNNGQIYSGQQALSQTLANEANGGGPNPAQLQYQQNAEAIAQQAAQRNSQNRALNPGLAARLSGQESVSTGNTAASTAAAQQAQQQLSSQSELAGLYGTMGNQQLQQQQLYDQAYDNAQQINAKTASENAAATQKVTGGVYNTVGAIGGALMSALAKGGEVPGHLHKIASIYHAKALARRRSTPSVPIARTALKIPTRMGALSAKSGGKVPGKAQVKGNSYKNDTVLAMISPGEIVLPRSVTQAKDAPRKAAEFVKHLMDEKNRARGYEGVVKAKKSAQKAREDARKDQKERRGS